MTLIERVREFMVNHIAVGSRLEFRQVYGFPDYYVSSAGHLISSHKQKLKFLKPEIQDGYKRARLFQAARLHAKFVHRIMLESFLGPQPECMETRHKNGIRHDNRIENLEWGTPQQNTDDKISHGTHSFGETNGRAKLTELQVRAIYASGDSAQNIANTFGIKVAQVNLIKRGGTWRHLNLNEQS